MVALKLENFGGMIPVVDQRLLPPNQAVLSENAWLTSGAVEGYCVPTQVHTLVNPNAEKVFRIPKLGVSKDYIPDSYWMEFDNRDTDVIRSPAVGDTFERVYWCSPSESPKYNTKARIIAGASPFLLGVPAPTVAPTASVTGGSPPIETRAYVYAWVSAYGEEGPPSPPVTAAGNADGTWTIAVTPPGSAAVDRNLTTVRLYRTITSSAGAATYYFVSDSPIATTTITDTASTLAVSGNNILDSLFYEPPPSDLEGMTAMPNGIVAGFRKNEVWFCEPYQPHAWPSAYTLAVESDIVGLGVVGQTLIVCTAGSPYAISGVSPGTMAVSRLAYSEPCLSRGSIVSSPRGVVYASPNGLVLANPGSVQPVTEYLFSRKDWLDPAKVPIVTRLRASLLNGDYYAWGSSGQGAFDAEAFNAGAFSLPDYAGAYNGVQIDFSDTRMGYTKLSADELTQNCFMDLWTGETLVVRSGKVYWIDVSPERGKLPFIWQSKSFELANKRNLAAMRIFYDEDTPIDGPMTSGIWDDTVIWDDSAFWYDDPTNTYGTVKVYADDRLAFTRDLRESGELMRLPSGFKAMYWQIRIEARVRLKAIEVAAAAKELGGV